MKRQIINSPTTNRHLHRRQKPPLPPPPTPPTIHNPQSHHHLHHHPIHHTANTTTPTVPSPTKFKPMNPNYHGTTSPPPTRFEATNPQHLICTITEVNTPLLTGVPSPRHRHY
ncbi:velvet complex subunit B-like [Olea europaea var. sylvestris]|uniref:velvet complex subunit B-like n=1 Tax=Olea europaea var. sylvestris TaxID=158386 RepID=UPI000C1D4E68|nr:velvet complex subunit B-like [Olea europaea var. sylvestris]